MWEIRDWMNNLLFDGKRFDYFSEAWDFIYATNPEPDPRSVLWVDGWYDDYYVVEVK